MATELTPPSSPGRAFLAVLYRDVYVTWGELPIFLVQVIVQPLFLLFVFGKVLGTLGYTRGDYADLLFPGLLALTAVITGMQTLAFPLVAEFGWTKEIEDRLLAPLPTDLVAVEKLLMATIRGLISAVIMYPIGVLVLGSAPWHPARLSLLLLAVLLGAWVGAGIGITLGTLIPPARISLMFGLILTPLMFTGATQYAWPLLAQMRWFQVVTALNPLTYCAEAVRAAMVPDVPHIRAWISILALLVAAALFTVTGVLSFRRRAHSG